MLNRLVNGMIATQSSSSPRNGVRNGPFTANGVSVGVTLASILTAAFLIGHAPFIVAGPDGIDSANFTLALDRYDPSLHQPHPPGFPVHIALGRLVTQVYQTVAAGDPGEGGVDAAGLRVWSVISGALAVLSLTWIAITLGESVSRGFLVAALAATCPLFWVTAMRPLSDVPGLCFSMLSQALALAAYAHRLRCARETAAVEDEPTLGAAVNYRLLGAGLVAGLAVGVRVQTAFLTVPLLAFVTLIEARRGGRSVIIQMPVAVACGMLAWAVPMMNALPIFNRCWTIRR